jgi:hypothetical protein
MITTSGESHRWRALKTPASIVFFYNLQNFKPWLTSFKFHRNFPKYLKIFEFKYRRCVSCKRSPSLKRLVQMGL